MTTGRDWKSTVMVINFDEWGGFFEHVAPVEAPDFKLESRRAPDYVVPPFVSAACPGT